MPTHVQVRSLAKINLDLRVLHKRPDGYHDLRTIFQTISLADTIDITYSPGRTKIDINGNLNIPDNLIAKATDSVLAATRKTARIGFVFSKRIPLGAGLGGGSSNAAAVLLALPRMLGKPLPTEKLIELAASLGSDVPFFLLGGAAVGLGRGTELYPLPDLPAFPSLLITPGIHVSTPEAYRALARSEATPDTAPILAFQSLVSRLPDSRLECQNDFETVVFRQHPQLESIREKLLKLGARPALMSGSGSTVFGIFAKKDLRDRAAQAMRREFAGDQVHSVQLVSRSRYNAMWRRQLAGVRG
jgi:4-diphosphocytidyl-2-C-methyl-D-erythritol kinase